MASGMERPVSSKVQAGAYGSGVVGAVLTILMWVLSSAEFGPQWVIPPEIVAALSTLLMTGGAFFAGWVKQENSFFPEPPAGTPLVSQEPGKE